MEVFARSLCDIVNKYIASNTCKVPQRNQKLNIVNFNECHVCMKYTYIVIYNIPRLALFLFKYYTGYNISYRLNNKKTKKLCTYVNKIEYTKVCNGIFVSYLLVFKMTMALCNVFIFF